MSDIYSTKHQLLENVNEFLFLMRRLINILFLVDLPDLQNAVSSLSSVGLFTVVCFIKLGLVAAFRSGPPHPPLWPEGKRSLNRREGRQPSFDSPVVCQVLF